MTAAARPGGEAPPATHPAPAGRFRIDGWTVDPATNQLMRDGRQIRLEPKVMDVLVYLAGRPGQVVSRDEIEREVWRGVVVGYDTVTGAVQKLRRAFDDSAREPRVIETLSKRGYRLIAAVTVVPAAAAGGLVPRPLRRRPLRAFMAATALAALVALAWLGPWQQPPGGTVAPAATPSLAVLPFDNLSGDPQQGYLADGLTDDLITLLAKQPGLLVIARDSTFVYRGEIADLAQVSRSLGARFVLRGSVRREGALLHVNAQLVDVPQGGHLWAERYDTPRHEIFGVQDRIVEGVLAALRPGTGMDGGAAVSRSGDVAAYDRFLYGRQSFYLYANREENRRAREFFREALAIDPGFAGAYAMLAWTHAFDAMNGWSDDRAASLDTARDLATVAIGIQPDLPVAYFVRGLTHRERGDYVKALVEAEKAIEFDPNYANAHLLLATLLYYAGRPEEGLARVRKAMRINPHHPHNYPFHLGQAYFVLHRYDEAITAFRDGLATNPASERLHVWLAAAHARAGDVDEARWEADQVKTLNPDFSIARMREAFPFSDPAEVDHFVGGLRLAGLGD